MYECNDFNFNQADEMTSQLDMAGYVKFYKTTSLSSEQKVLAAADFMHDGQVNHTFLTCLRSMD
jgi:hypothetical protein